MADRWTVIKQRQTLGRDAAGDIVPTVEITFKTTTGVVGTVDVPVAEFDVDRVRQAIDDRVDHIEAVQQL